MGVSLAVMLGVCELEGDTDGVAVVVPDTDGVDDADEVWLGVTEGDGEKEVVGKTAVHTPPECTVAATGHAGPTPD